MGLTIGGPDTLPAGEPPATGPRAGSYSLPDYVRTAGLPLGGIPWDRARPMPEMNSYSGIVPDSFLILPGGVLFYESKFAIDGDGAGGNAEADPYYQKDTSLHDALDRPLNSREMPFIVLPGKHDPDGRPQWSDLDVIMGDLAVCFYRDKWCPVLFGDGGPSGKLGEGSMAAASRLGISPDPVRGGIGPDSVPPGVLHFVFPKSRNLGPRGKSGRPNTQDTAETVDRRVRALFEALKTGAR